MLGSNLTRALAERGDEVVVLARSADKARQQLGDSVRVILGDLDNVAAFAAALDGVDVIFHTAAYFREYYAPGEHWPILLRRNVEATEQLLRQAEQCGVRRFVHTSSSGVIGAGQRGAPGVEQTPPEPGSVTYRNAYFRSKLVADGRVRAFVARGGPLRVTVHPGWMFGPGDAAPTSSGRLVLDFLAGRLPVVTGLGTNVADARDVAAGMIAAAVHDDMAASTGERYILAGPTTTMVEIVTTLAQVTGRRRSRFTVPGRVAIAAARAESAISRVTRHTPRTNRDALETLRAHPVESAKAFDLLGSTFRPLADTLTDEVAWLRHAGLAPAN